MGKRETENEDMKCRDEMGRNSSPWCEHPCAQDPHTVM